MPNHLANWALSFFLASVGVWSTWINYQLLGVRDLAPNWVLLNERALVTAELLALMVGALVTVYRTGTLLREAARQV